MANYNPHVMELLPPFTDGTNNSNVAYYTATTTAMAGTALPTGWQRRFVHLQCYSDDCWVLFSQVATTVDKTKTAADKALGFRLVQGICYRVEIPRVANFISIQANASTTILLALLDNQAGVAAAP